MENNQLNVASKINKIQEIYDKLIQAKDSEILALNLLIKNLTK